MAKRSRQKRCCLHPDRYMHALTNICDTASVICKRWIWCTDVTQLKHILALGNLSPAAFILNPFANITAISERTGGIWGLSMSALTESFPLSHITNHLLSTYPVFKAIFPLDGRSVVCIKVKPQSHLPIFSLNEKPQFQPLRWYLLPCKKEAALHCAFFFIAIDFVHFSVQRLIYTIKKSHILEPLGIIYRASAIFT